jgi:hypothetical protein
VYNNIHEYGTSTLEIDITQSDSTDHPHQLSNSQTAHARRLPNLQKLHAVSPSRDLTHGEPIPFLETSHPDLVFPSDRPRLVLLLASQWAQNESWTRPGRLARMAQVRQDWGDPNAGIRGVPDIPGSWSDDSISRQQRVDALLQTGGSSRQDSALRRANARDQSLCRVAWGMSACRSDRSHNYTG